ncbi:hypothetical protein XELAEV_18009691mg [Xenopus laevis]|uniref:Uncharacterized protein n=1 Tax=Xenopus laevis TaxID=8355 RepID=A0A974DV81_XENLA|nr:hypothetical protein XELAEV_18009691mg [Xenopus laevis]
MADGPTTSTENHASSDSASEIGNNIEGILTALAQIPNKTDLQTLIKHDLKHTIHTEMATLKQELASVQDTLEDLEECIMHISTDTLVNVKTLQKHDQAILDLRRKNSQSRVQRGNFPWDVLCCLVRFEIKDQILQKARNVDGFMFENSTTPQFCQQLDLPIPDLTEWRNYILGPPEEPPQAHTMEPPTTPRTRRDFSPSRQWRK